MKRKMKLLLADLFIGALALVYGCPLWWIGMINVWKTALLRLPLHAQRIMRTINPLKNRKVFWGKNIESPKSRETFWGNSKREGEQLI